jgi:hypothetical protein
LINLGKKTNMSDFRADQNELNGSFAKFGVTPLNESLMDGPKAKKEGQVNGSFMDQSGVNNAANSFELAQSPVRKDEA